MCVEIRKCASGMGVRGKVWTSKATRFGIFFDNKRIINKMKIKNDKIKIYGGGGGWHGLYGLARFYCTFCLWDCVACALCENRTS